MPVNTEYLVSCQGMHITIIFSARWHSSSLVTYSCEYERDRCHHSNGYLKKQQLFDLSQKAVDHPMRGSGLTAIRHSSATAGLLHAAFYRTSCGLAPHAPNYAGQLQPSYRGKLSITNGRSPQTAALIDYRRPLINQHRIGNDTALTVITLAITFMALAPVPVPVPV